jgi:uncharacterized membrane-anchored protein
VEKMDLIQKIFEIIIAVVLLWIFLPVIFELLIESGMNPVFTIIAFIMLIVGLIAAFFKAIGG